MSSAKLPAKQRQETILKSVKETGVAAISTLAKAFGVSEMTIRRDLDRLDQQKLLIRTHGGAISFDQSNELNVNVIEPSFGKRASLNQAAKLAIAQCAVDMIGDSQAIAVDIGTTTFELGSLIRFMPLRVFTYSLRIANLMSQTNPNVYIPGGKISRIEPSVIGIRAIEYLNNYNFDIAFIGASGLMTSGIYDYSPEDTEIKKVLIKRSMKSIVLLDSSKFEHLSSAQIAGLDEIDVLITDQRPPDRLYDALQLDGVLVKVAEVATQTNN